MKLNISKEWLYNEYILNFRTLTSIANELNVSVPSIRYHIIKNNIDLRGNNGRKRSKKEKIKISEKTKEAMRRPEVRKRFMEGVERVDRKGKNNPFYGKTHTDESKRKMGKIRKKYTDENSANWKGGKYHHWHKKAWKLFGKDKCEICEISLQKSIKKFNQRLSMHNTLEPKDYTLMKQEAWQCLCKKCHTSIDNGYVIGRKRNE